MFGMILWYLILAAIGWLVWPMLFRLLPGLPDRGYSVSRALGLLLVGYVFWLLASFGMLRNTPGSILVAWLIVIGLSAYIYLRRGENDLSLFAWISENRRMILTAEMLALVAFGGWLIVRAYNPNIAGTEKPMELAFLNGVRTSEVFPPRDPWLAGYAISYYYFGYVLVAMLADLTGTISSIAFNLAIPTLFSLTLLTSYGLLYNLIMASHTQDRPVNREAAASTSLLAPIMVGIMGNLEGFLELLRAIHLPFIGPGFWQWVDIEDISEPLTTALWPPGSWRYWWWWRASRVIQDRDLAGTSIGLQPIDEFPYFSFLLGDMHPHVLALPFVIAVLALALNFFLQPGKPDRYQIGLYALIFGGLAFLNTWDLPIYAFVLMAVLVLRAMQDTDGTPLRAVGTGLVILMAGGIAYLPWYISFTSQAGGILPNALFPTRLHQFFVMFGPFLFVIVCLLISELYRHRQQVDWSTGLVAGIGLLVLLSVLVFAAGTLALRSDPGVQAFVVQSAGFSIDGLNAEEITALIPDATRAIIQHRLTHPLTALFLTLLLIGTVARILMRPPDEAESERSGQAITFVFILILTGVLLTIGPEFLYLRDNFGQRLNTIFKFYFAAWILFGVSAAYGTYVLIRRLKQIPRAAFTGITVFLIAAGLVYPALATPNKAEGFQSTDTIPTLDGIAFIRDQYPADYAGIQWLIANADRDAIVLEAVGGAYSYYGRVSMATGLPTLMGWSNHERQWRGDLYGELAGTREQDIQEIYNTPSITRANQLLNDYGVTYVFVGSLERNPDFASPTGLQKFERFLTAVYNDNGVIIYSVEQPLAQEQQ